jgi:hypothetical protein
MASNLEIVNNWLNGENFRPLSICFSQDEESDDIAQKKAKCEIGDCYEDHEGNVWKKMGATSWAKQPKILGTGVLEPTWKTCRVSGRPISSKLDEQMYRLYKKCFDQVLEEEHELRMKNLYKPYAALKVLMNQKSGMEEIIKQCESALEELKDEKNISVVMNEFGDLDEMDIPKTKIRKDIKSDIRKAKKALKDIHKAIEEVDEETVQKIAEVVK